MEPLCRGAKALFKAAESLVDYKGSRLRFAAVWLPKAADPKKDAHMAFYGPSGKKLDFAGAWTEGFMAKWVKQATYESIGTEFKPQKYGAEAVQDIGSIGSVVGVYKDENRSMLEFFQKLATSETSWKWTMVSESSLEHPDTLAFKEAPQVTVLHGDKKYVPWRPSKAWRALVQVLPTPSETSLQQLLADVVAKKAKAYYKSVPWCSLRLLRWCPEAPKPAEALEDGVTVLTGDLFEEVAMNAKKDVAMACEKP